MKTVEFLKPWQIYSRGDIAGFEPEVAEKLVAGKVAKPHESDAESKSTKAAK